MDLKIKKAFSVIGVGYGDEGKGLAVDYIASQNPNSIVFRHSGGHQVGHTVKIGDKLHEFRHFGSATFRNIATIWDKRCTVSPIPFEMEYKKLTTILGVTPRLYCDDFCPVTTLYDVAYNRAKEKQYKTGSVGVGFGSTLKRQEFVPLYVMDLRYKFVLNEKLRNISSFYFTKVDNEGITDLYMEELGELGNIGYTLDCFIESAKFFIDHIYNAADFKNEYFDTIIFEGNQGILLDKYHGFYPNVTYGYTTNRKVKYDALNTFYVSRCYATRHGHGTLKNENLEIPSLINTECEQNHLNPYQDDFRIAMLDHSLVDYAIKCDQAYGKNATSNLLFTCLDQYINPKMTFEDKVVDFDLSKFSSLVDNIYVNDSPESKTVKLWN